MSRRLLNEKHCVRCGRKTATPYLRKYSELLRGSRTDELSVLDLGCGNGRNSRYMAAQGHSVTPLDMVDDYGAAFVLGNDRFPVDSGSQDIILCNYVLMFLNPAERRQVIKEIKRVASSDASIMVELYDAKDSFARDRDSMLEMQNQIFRLLGWHKLRYSQGRFIATKAER